MAVFPGQLLASEPAKLPTKARDAIRRASQGTGIAISAITSWELAWLATHDRLEITGTVEAFVEKISSRTAIRPVTVKVAVPANQLPVDYSGDPCDRLPNRDWWDIAVDTIRNKVRPDTWFLDFTPYDANNPTAWRGAHNLSGRLIVIFDEASDIHPEIWALPNAPAASKRSSSSVQIPARVLEGSPSVLGSVRVHGRPGR